MTAPYAGIQIPQPGKSLQRERRVWRIFTDQHGRRFGAQADMATNAPIAEFQPQGFMPPWLPAMRYAKFAQTGDLDFRWDYDANAEDWSELTGAYYDSAVQVSLQLPGEVPTPEIGGAVDRRIRAVLGQPPSSPAIPLACKAGDPWMLGKPGAKDALGMKPLLQQQLGANSQEALAMIRSRLAAQAEAEGMEAVPTLPEKPLEVERKRSITDRPDVPITYQQFVAEAKARGMTHAEATLAWKDHKANLAEATV